MCIFVHHLYGRFWHIRPGHGRSGQHSLRILLHIVRVCLRRQQSHSQCVDYVCLLLITQWFGYIRCGQICIAFRLLLKRLNLTHILQSPVCCSSLLCDRNWKIELCLGCGRLPVSPSFGSWHFYSLQLSTIWFSLTTFWWCWYGVCCWWDVRTAGWSFIRCTWNCPIWRNWKTWHTWG